MGLVDNLTMSMLNWNTTTDGMASMSEDGQQFNIIPPAELLEDLDHWDRGGEDGAGSEEGAGDSLSVCCL